jgi:hypothetical protein
MQRPRDPVCAIALVAALAAAPLFAASSNGGDPNAFGIETQSTAPHLVTDGNVLVRIDVPRNVSLESARVTLNGVDVTAKFIADASTQSMTGLVTGLVLGENALEASAPRGDGQGGPNKKLMLTNYPITGADHLGSARAAVLLSDGAVQPANDGRQSWTAPRRKLLDRDADRLRVLEHRQYVQRPLNTAASVPVDLAMTTTTAGKTVRFIVRIETGTINRGIYQIAILHDPYTEGAPTWANHPAGWNGKLIYQHGGGCPGGWYIQANLLQTGGRSTQQNSTRARLRARLVDAQCLRAVTAMNCSPRRRRSWSRSGSSKATACRKYTIGTGAPAALTRVTRPRTIIRGSSTASSRRNRFPM